LPELGAGMFVVPDPQGAGGKAEANPHVGLGRREGRSIPDPELIETIRDRQIGEAAVMDTHPSHASFDVARHAEGSEQAPPPRAAVALPPPAQAPEGPLDGDLGEGEREGELGEGALLLDPVRDQLVPAETGQGLGRSDAPLPWALRQGRGGGVGARVVLGLRADHRGA
jgi:hypothetical protein